jgi:hypothetical protein
MREIGFEKDGNRYIDWTKSGWSEKICSDKQIVLSKENHLSELKIFPEYSVAEKNYITGNNVKGIRLTPYVIRKGIYSNPLALQKIGREKLMAMLREGEFHAKHLPLKYRKDHEVMMEAIKANPFAMVFAHKGLKEDSAFVLQAMRISLRTLVFLTLDTFRNRNRSNALLPKILDELMRLLKPHEFNFIVHKLGTFINSTISQYREFYFEPTPYTSNNLLSSFEKEISNNFSTYRAGMLKPIRLYFIREATKRGYFNKDGYFNSMEHARKRKSEVLYLDLSFGLKLWDLNELAQFEHLKILKISMCGIRSSLPVLKELEELYIDGSPSFWDFHEAVDFNKLFPRLKRLYSRDNHTDFSRHIDAILSVHPEIEFMDVRPYYPYEKEDIGKVLDKFLQQGRNIEIPLNEFNEPDDLPF